MKKLTQAELFRAILTAVAEVTVFSIVSKITLYSITAMAVSGGNESLYKDIPNFAVYLIAFAATVLMLATFSGITATFDRRASAEYLEAYNEGSADIGFSSFFKSPRFVFRGATILVLIAVLSVLGAFPEVGASFFNDGSHRAGYFPMLIMLPITALILILSEYEARRYWRQLYDRRELEFLGMRHMIKRTVIAVVLYPVVFPLAPILAFMVYTLVNVLATLTDIFSVIGVVLAIAFLVFLVFAIAYIRAMRQRRGFIKRLTELSRRCGYELSRIAAPYRSFFFSSIHETFSLKRDGEIYSCTMIPTLNRKTPFFFTSSTDGYFRHRLGTKRHHTTLNHNISFYHGEVGRRILIINPDVKYIFVTENKTTRKLTGVDKIWDVTLYDGASFLGAVERGHIGKV